MTIEIIRSTIEQVLTEIQERSGHGTPQIVDETCPVGDLEGFDSLNIVETAVLLSERLQCKIGYRLLLPNCPNQPLPVSEIATRIYTQISRKK